MIHYTKRIDFSPIPVVVAALLLGILLFGSQPVRAQFAGTDIVKSSLPPPPAWAIASRMFKKGDYDDAIKQLSNIVSSATYRKSPYAPEALYSIAHIYEAQQHDDNSAINELNQLVNSYSGPNYTYPHKSVVLAERNALGVRIDRENRAASLRGPSDWSSIASIKDAVLASGYVVVDFFVRLTGGRNYSYSVALLLIAVIVRLLLWPLSIKQYKSMKEMQRLQPLIKDLQAKYKNDKTTLQAKQLELFKEHNVNPAAGCLPMILQFPVFIYMYHAVWLYQYRFTHGTFLWICPSMHRLAPGIFGSNLSDQDIILLALYSISMYVTQRMMPVADPQQAEMQRTSALMSAVLFFVLFQNYHFPSAFVLYWLFSNVVSTLVQKYVMRSGSFLSLPPLASQPPSDGEVGGGNGRNGSSYVLEAPVSPGNGQSPIANGTKPGAAKGMIAPKSHPKKKRR